MTDKLYYEYYDKIFSGKDYRREAEVVLEIARSVAGSYPKRILDVGCGTGSHDIIFAEKGCEVTGIDIDRGAVEVAIGKAGEVKGPKPTFMHKDVEDLDDGGFDLAVSLFNVVNYINGVEEMLGYLGAVSECLVEGAPFIFDSWNGIAAILDPPRVKESTVNVGGEVIEISTRPETDIMDQSVHVVNDVKVIGPDGRKRKFQFCYSQTLWTKQCLKDLLSMSGFELLKVSAWMEPEVEATSKTWKIMYVCRKAEGDVKGGKGRG